MRPAAKSGRGIAARALAPVAVGTAVAALVAAVMLASEQPWTLHGDNRFIHYPMTLAAYRSWLAARIPEWSGGLFLGYPLLADPVTAALYPPHLLAFAVTPPPHLRAYDLATALHAGLLAAGSLVLLRLLGAGFLVAVFGAALALASPFTHWWAHGFLPQWSSLAWWPWVFVAVEGLSRPGRSTFGAYAMLGWVALASQVLVGYPEYALYSGTAAAAWLFTRRGGPSLRARLARVSVLAAGGAAIAAPQLLPTWVTARESLRSGLPDPLLSRFVVVTPGEALASVLPWASAGAGERMHLGAAAAALALLAVVRRKPRAGFLAALAVVAVVLSLGSRGALYDLLHALPGFRVFRGPVKFWPFAELAVAWGAGLGIAALPARRRTLTALLAMIIGTAALAERSIHVWPLLRRYAGLLPDERAVRDDLAFIEASGLARETLRTAPPDRVAILLPGSPVVFGNLGMVFGLESPSGGSTPLVGRRQLAILARSPRADEIDLLGVRFVLTTPQLCRTLAHRYGLRPWMENATACVLENVDRPPRYELPAEWRVVAAEESMLDEARRETPGGFVVVGPADALAPYLAGPSPGEVAVLSYREGRVRLRVSAARPALLLVREAWAPGWDARVDGVATPLLPAAGVFFAVRVSPGDHVVDLRYRAPALRLGFGLAGGWLVLVAVAALRRHMALGTLHTRGAR